MGANILEVAGIQALQQLHFQHKYEKIHLLKDVLEGENRRHRRLDRAIDFLRSKARIRLLSGGNRSGKTFLGTADLLWQAQGDHPYRDVPRPPVFLRQFTVNEKKIFEVGGLLAHWEELTPRESLRGGSFAEAFDRGNLVLHFANGSVVQFMTYAQELEVVQGAMVHCTHFDECPDYSFYKESQTRIGPGADANIIITMTPWEVNRAGTIQIPSWVIDKLWARACNNEKAPIDQRSPQIEGFFLHTEDNPDLTDKQIADMVAEYTSHAEIRARTKGEFTVLAGLTFPEFKEEVHVVEPFPLPDDATYYAAMDYHPVSPTAISFFFVQPNQDVYVYDVIPWGIGPGVNQIAQAFIAGRKKKNIREVFADPSFLGHLDVEHGEKTVREIFEEKHGISFVDAPHGPAAQNQRYGILRDYLQATLRTGMDNRHPALRLFRTANMKRVIWEFNHLINDIHLTNPDRKEVKQKVRAKDNHYIDTLGYGLQMGLYYVPLGARSVEAERPMYAGAGF
jgi:phage terminase large subunit-like protein